MEDARKRFRLIKYLMTAVLLALPIASFAAPILKVSEGQLVGAEGVMVEGTRYNVDFLEGSCISLYSGCTSSATLPFLTLSEAASAADALLEQVLIDGPLGNFDTQPELTFGCSLSAQCLLTTLYGVISDGGQAVYAATADNRPSGDLGAQTGFQSVIFKGTDTSTNNRAVFAVWSQSPVSVPEPSSLGLLALSLIGLGAFRKARSS